MGSGTDGFPTAPTETKLLIRKHVEDENRSYTEKDEHREKSAN